MLIELYTWLVKIREHREVTTIFSLFLSLYDSHPGIDAVRLNHADNALYMALHSTSVETRRPWCS